MHGNLKKVKYLKTFLTSLTSLKRPVALQARTEAKILVFKVGMQVLAHAEAVSFWVILVVSLKM